MSPVLRLVRGNATPEELGAVVALLVSRSGAATEEPAVPTPSLWSRPQLRGPLTPGPGAWTASAFRT
jgi:hypothetical protein